MISVCICTYNRADSLQRTLESLARQSASDELIWELLLIDNNSSDQTAKVAEAAKHSLPLRYIFEGIQGLSAARNRAVQEFKGQLLVFTDDDVVLDEHWLAAYANADAEYPAAGYFGGRILPLWDHGQPSWLQDPSLALISGLLVYYDLGEANRYFTDSDATPFGASFAIRRQLLQQIPGFRVDLGVNAGSLGRGEEADFLQRARDQGSQGVYLGQALCYHTQSSDRFRIPYLFRYGIGKGAAEVLMAHEADASRGKQLEFFLRGAWQLLKGRGDRFRQCIINMGIQEGILRSRSAVKP